MELKTVPIGCIVVRLFFATSIGIYSASAFLFIFSYPAEVTQNISTAESPDTLGTIKMTESSLIEFIGHICKRPSMYTGGSVKETLAFIDGFRFGNATPISGKIFDRYVCVRNSFPDNYVWSYVINTCSKDENDAMRMIEETIAEFLQLKRRMSDDELMQYASEQLVEESDAEKIFRQFYSALLSGNESMIQQLIEEHIDAEILWKETYPQDVAIQLNEISASQRIRSIPISVDGKKIKIIAQGWPFPIEMNFTNGEWRINAEKIIELRMNNNCA